jgi:WD40 repeat protein
MTSSPVRAAYGKAEDIKGCFSPDGRRLAVACSDGTSHIWDVERLEPLVTLPPIPSRIEWLSFSRDGSRLAVGTRKEIRLLDPATADQVASFEAQDTKLFSAVFFTPDGNTLIALADNAAYSWHAPPVSELIDEWLKAAPASQAQPVNRLSAEPALPRSHAH